MRSLLLPLALVLVAFVPPAEGDACPAGSPPPAGTTYDAPGGALRVTFTLAQARVVTALTQFEIHGGIQLADDAFLLAFGHEGDRQAGYISSGTYGRGLAVEASTPLGETTIAGLLPCGTVEGDSHLTLGPGTHAFTALAGSGHGGHLRLILPSDLVVDAVDAGNATFVTTSDMTCDSRFGARVAIVAHQSASGCVATLATSGETAHVLGGHYLDAEHDARWVAPDGSTATTGDITIGAGPAGAWTLEVAQWETRTYDPGFVAILADFG